MEKASFKKTRARPPRPGFLVNALVLDQSTLNALASSRNIVDFFGESLLEYTRKKRSPASVTETAQQCRSSMEKLLRLSDGLLENAVVVILKEFLMEIDSVCRILEEHSSQNLSTEIPVELEGKMYKTRYLSNVLGNEIAELKNTQS